MSKFLIKTKLNIYKFVCLITIFFWTIICHSSIFNIYNINLYNVNIAYTLKPLVIISSTIVVLILFSCLYKLSYNFSKNICNKIVLIGCILSFLTLLYWGFNNQIMPTYDLPHILDLLKSIDKGYSIGYSDYLSIYPHQIPLVVLLTIIKCFSEHLNLSFETLIIIYNCLMITLSFWILYKICVKLFDYRIALISFLLLLLTPDCYLYASYYYTDIISIPYMLFGFYILLQIDNKNRLKKLLYSIISSLLFMISIKIRVVNLFVLLSFCVVYLLNKNMLMFIKRFYIFIISFVVCFIIYSNAIIPLFNIKIDHKLTLPATHWIMMGVNTQNDGSYLEEDVTNTIMAKDKVSYNISIIKKRLKKADINFYFNKLRRVWSLGDYGVLPQYKNMKTYGEMYDVLNNDGNILIRYLQQIFKVVTYLLFFVSIVINYYSKKNEDINIFVFTIFFAIVFYLIWEAQTRYSFTFLPLIIIGGVNGIKYIDKILDVERVKFSNKIIKVDKIKKLFFGFVMVIIIFMLIGYQRLVHTKYEKNYVVQIQPQSSFDSSINITNRKLKQVFILKENFNLISVQFDKDNIKKDIDYNFELYNKNNQLLYFKKFNTSDIIQNHKTYFSPNVINNGENEYYFLIYSDYATEDNYLSIPTYSEVSCNTKYSDKYFDINPSAQTYYGSELLCYELQFSIYKRINSSALSEYAYFFFCSIIMIILTITTFLYKKVYLK